MKTWSTPVREEKNAAVPCCLCGSLSFKTALVCGGFGYVSCKRCSLVQQNPQPVKDEVIDRYSGSSGSDYLSYELENEENFLHLQQLALKDSGFYDLEKELMLHAQPSVLDIGCATGALPAFLRSRNWRVTGVEISPAGEYARNTRSLDIKSLPLEENKFPDCSFDAVLASHLIEHLNNPFSFLTEVHRILKENGRVFITTPNIKGFQAHLFGKKWRSAIFDHLYLFSLNTLKAMMKRTGFRTEKISTWGGLAAGTAPARLKKTADFLAKRFGFGDVMIIRAVRKQ